MPVSSRPEHGQAGLEWTAKATTCGGHLGAGGKTPWWLQTDGPFQTPGTEMKWHRLSALKGQQVESTSKKQEGQSAWRKGTGEILHLLGGKPWASSSAETWEWCEQTFLMRLWGCWEQQPAGWAVRSCWLLLWLLAVIVAIIVIATILTYLCLLRVNWNPHMAVPTPAFFCSSTGFLFSYLATFYFIFSRFHNIIDIQHWVSLKYTCNTLICLNIAKWLPQSG